MIKRVRARSAANDERGAVLLEFALVSTLLFLVTIGIMYWGLTFLRYNTASLMAREGARWAALRGDSITASDVQGIREHSIDGHNRGYHVDPRPETWKPRSRPSQFSGSDGDSLFSPEFGHGAKPSDHGNCALRATGRRGRKPRGLDRGLAVVGKLLSQKEPIAERVGQRILCVWIGCNFQHAGKGFSGQRRSQPMRDFSELVRGEEAANRRMDHRFNEQAMEFRRQLRLLL